MKKFEKLSRAEMRSIKAGLHYPPNCSVGSGCVTVRGNAGLCVAQNPADNTPCPCVPGGIMSAWDGVSVCAAPGS